jgi:hypothetical protein
VFAPPRVWRLPHQARCVHQPAAAFNVYKRRAPRSLTIFLFNLFSTIPLVASYLTMRSLPLLPRPT